MPVSQHLPPSVEIAQMICVTAHRGNGSDANPERLIWLYYSMEGRLLACYDPLNGPPDWFCSLADRATAEQARNLMRALRRIIDAADGGDAAVLTAAINGSRDRLLDLLPDEMK